eukprot:365361-Chlamydomonas_euryale.AAC.4
MAPIGLFMIQPLRRLRHAIRALAAEKRTDERLRERDDLPTLMYARSRLVCGSVDGLSCAMP